MTKPTKDDIAAAIRSGTSLYPGMWRDIQDGMNAMGSEEAVLMAGAVEDDKPNQQLKPCPHCGSSTAPHLWSHSEMMTTYDVDLDSSEPWAVVCDASTDNLAGCGASGGFMPTKEEAVAAWNRRA